MSVNNSPPPASFFSNTMLTCSLWFQVQLSTKVGLYWNLTIFHSYAEFYLPAVILNFDFSNHIFQFIGSHFCLLLYDHILVLCYTITQLYNIISFLRYVVFFRLFSACLFPLDFFPSLLTGPFLLFGGFHQVSSGNLALIYGC